MSEAERAIGRLEGKVDLMLAEQALMRKEIKRLNESRDISKGFKAAFLTLAGFVGGVAGFLSKFI